MSLIKVNEVFENFPDKTARHQQKKVIEDICIAFNSGCRYIILEAPTGFGKVLLE
jgi:ATP-dependent DNA helicase DinG